MKRGECMLNDYFNLNDVKEDKYYYLSLTDYNDSNKIGVDIIPEEIKRKDKLINRKDSLK